MLVNQFGAKIGSAGGGGFTPPTSTEFWWDCTDTSNMFTDSLLTTPVGSSTDVDVLSISDKTGNGYDLSNNASNQPSWKSTAFPDGLYFDGNEWLRVASATTEAGTAGDSIAVFGVGKFTGTAKIAAMASHAYNAFGWKLGFTNLTTPRFAIGNGSGTTVTIADTVSSIVDTTKLFAFNFDNDAASLNLEGFIDGASIGSETYSFDIGYDTSDRLGMGAMLTMAANVNNWRGYIDEILCLVNPSTQDFSDVETYLLNKYSL